MKFKMEQEPYLPRFKNDILPETETGEATDKKIAEINDEIAERAREGREQHGP